MNATEIAATKSKLSAKGVLSDADEEECLKLARHAASSYQVRHSQEEHLRILNSGMTYGRFIIPKDFKGKIMALEYVPVEYEKGTQVHGDCYAECIDQLVDMYPPQVKLGRFS